MAEETKKLFSNMKREIPRKILTLSSKISLKYLEHL